jgi:DNA-binding MarR family transcriptional regulator
VTEKLVETLKQTKPFASKEEEVVLALVHTATRVMEPWAQLLKTRFQLTVSQYNVLRILRGARPTRLSCREISEQMVARDPDVTRLLDRLADRGLVDRVRDRKDRRVVEVGITEAGLAMLHELDDEVDRFPRVAVGKLGPKRLEQLATLLQDLLSNTQPFPSGR